MIKLRKIRYSTELYHYGVKGQKWGIRRYQNSDGTLTAEGKQRYGTVENFHKHQKIKKALKTGAIVAGAVLAAYGGYRISQMLKGGSVKEISDIGKSIIEDSSDKLADGNLGFVSKTVTNGVAETFKADKSLTKSETSGLASSAEKLAGKATGMAGNSVDKTATIIVPALNNAKSSIGSYSSSRTYTLPSFDMRSALNKSLNDLNDMSGLNDLKNAQEELRRLREMLNGR